MEETRPMNKIERRIDLLNRVKWVGGIFGVVLYIAAEQPFGGVVASMLCFEASISFFRICEKESDRTLSDHVAEDIRKMVMSIGSQNCLVEIKKLQPGLVTRVYLINAGAKAPVYSQLVLDHIRMSWYKRKIWITQMVDIDSEADFNDAKETLDEELMKDIERMRDELKRK